MTPTTSALQNPFQSQEESIFSVDWTRYARRSIRDPLTAMELFVEGQMFGMRSFALAAIGMLLLGSSASAQLTFVPDPTPRISVTGVGQVEAQPDMATVSLGVYVLDRDLRQGKASSDVAVRRLLDVTTYLSIAPDDVTSSVLNIDPNYSDGEVPEFLGYEISRSLTVKLRDLSKLDRLVDRAIEAGANREFNVELSSSRIRELQDQAMAAAIGDAQDQARRLAEGFGARLGAVRQIGPGSGQNSLRSSATSSTISVGRGTFAPGTIKVRSEVSVTYLIGP